MVNRKKSLKETFLGNETRRRKKGCTFIIFFALLQLCSVCIAQYDLSKKVRVVFCFSADFLLSMWSDLWKDTKTSHYYWKDFPSNLSSPFGDISLYEFFIVLETTTRKDLLKNPLTSNMSFDNFLCTYKLRAKKIRGLIYNNKIASLRIRRFPWITSDS